MSETLITHDRDRKFFHDNQTSLTVKRICWSAVLTGVIATLIVHILMVLLGTAIGAGATTNIIQQNSLQHISIRILVWTTLNMLLAIIVGSYLAGRFARQQGMLHGLLVFGISTIIMLWLAFSVAGNLIGGAFNMIGTGTNILKQQGNSNLTLSVAEELKNDLEPGNVKLNDLYISLKKTLNDDNIVLKKEEIKTNSQKNIDNILLSEDDKILNIEIPIWIYNVVGKYYDTMSFTDRDIIKNIIKDRTGKNIQEVERLINQIKQIYNANIEYSKKTRQKVAEQKARKAAEQTAIITAKISWYTFFLLLIEILLAARMGLIGERSNSLNK